MKSKAISKLVSKILIISCAFIITASCNRSEIKKEEQLTISEYQKQNEQAGISTNKDSVQNQLASSPSSVLLTGMDRFRLIPIYKLKPKSERNIQFYEETTYYDYGDNEDEDNYKYYMPGIDIISGYNLINIGHYDIEKDTFSYFFETPVLIKTLYFPGVKKDSLNHKPVLRDYFLVSAYDEDTNMDSLINKKDLRKIYHIDKFNTKKTRLLPEGYSTIRSTYDYKNDIMYIYAKHDANRNGILEKEEPMAIFWIRLNDPTVVKKIM